MSDELPRALARIEELERQLYQAQQELHPIDQAQANEASARERAIELEEERQFLEKQIEGYALGLEMYRSNPQFGGVINAEAVITELKRIIGRDYAPMQRDKAKKGLLSDKWSELTLIAAGHDKVSTPEHEFPEVTGYEPPIRLPVPETIRRQGGLGPVIIAAEYVANQWELGNMPTEESLETLSKAMKLYSTLTRALDKGRCEACKQVICQCPKDAA